MAMVVSIGAVAVTLTSYLRRPMDDPSSRVITILTSFVSGALVSSWSLSVDDRMVLGVPMLTEVSHSIGSISVFPSRDGRVPKVFRW